MPEEFSPRFSSPEEEIRYLREQIADKERKLLESASEVDKATVESIAKQELKNYISFTPKSILDPKHQLTEHELVRSGELVDSATDPVEEIINIMREKGVRNALAVLEKANNAYIIDEVHRRMIEEIRNGAQTTDIKEGVPLWHLLHMTLYEVAMPAQKTADGQERQLNELVNVMQQLLAGLRTIGMAKEGNHYTLEIALADDSDDIIFYVAVPNEFKSLFEKQTLSLFSNAVLTVQPHDYNIYVDGGHSLVADVTLSKHSIYPLKTHEDFSADPLLVILNAFSKIERQGGGAAVQFIIRHPSKDYRKQYEKIIKEMEKGTKAGEAIARSTFAGDMLNEVTNLFLSVAKNKDDKEKPKEIDQELIEQFKKKLNSPIVDVNIRLVTSNASQDRAFEIMRELQSAFNQFDSLNGNQLKFQVRKGVYLRQAQKEFSFRQLSTKTLLPLTFNELATLVHFPGNGIVSTPQFKQSQSKTAPAPTEMPTAGTLLGINKHRGLEKRIYVTEQDRMRHFYVIGQTGVGKSAFLQNLVMQDIKSGAGVCMIDPHGTDIQEIIGTIPPERENDVIYLDPSRLDRVIGLNMLEYDPTKPEQMTFVVNELLSIFQKLYGANPESLGPMFEQYFRNSTLLVMEDPESGNTLMDISRVMADPAFRRRKLAKAKNPVVLQFWQEIAGKAGGDASLENVVPYIVAKIDPLTANSYIRPIIGQQTSSFNFRQIMDERKILLVNLSKGRLGELNANLIGMVVVGKILMAALSRVDDPSKSFPPFFLHIDEFQNISTPAIASILSEARKYKLSLTVAHQYIAQLDQVIRDAVFGNVGSMAVLRVGNSDADVLEPQFSPVFTANDLMNTPNYTANLRILANGVPKQPFSVSLMPPPEFSVDRIEHIINLSYERYGRPLAEVEEEIRQRYQKPVPTMPPLPPHPL